MTNWTEADVIHTYTRREAIDDGVLVDITQIAAEAGIGWPVAMTAGAWAETVAWSPENRAVQDEDGRLWDVLTMARLACRSGGRLHRVTFQVLRVPNTPRATQPRLVHLALIVGPGDTGEPVLTITLPHQD